MFDYKAKNKIMSDIEDMVYRTYIEWIDTYYDGTKETYDEICDFICKYLKERATEEKALFKNRIT